MSVTGKATTQQFVQANNGEIIRALHRWPFVWGIHAPPHEGPAVLKGLHVTSSPGVIMWSCWLQMGVTPLLINPHDPSDPIGSPRWGTWYHVGGGQMLQVSLNNHFHNIYYSVRNKSIIFFANLITHHFKWHTTELIILCKITIVTCFGTHHLEFTW